MSVEPLWVDKKDVKLLIVAGINYPGWAKTCLFKGDF